MNINNQFIAGIKWTTLATFSITICNILKISILARFLSKDDLVFSQLCFFSGLL